MGATISYYDAHTETSNGNPYFGYGSSTRYWVRYVIQCDSKGISQLKFKQPSLGKSSGTAGGECTWIITTNTSFDTSPTPQTGVCYTGTTSPRYDGSSWYVLEFTASDLLLIPNKTYYLYIYQNVNTSCLYYWNYKYEIQTSVTDGVGGVVSFYLNDWTKAIPWIYYDGAWHRTIPYIYSGDWKNTC